MASQSRNNCDESIPVDHAVVEEPLHGRFPLQLVPSSVVEFRHVNVDRLCESDFDGIADSGLPYSDHDYIGSNPNIKCPPDACQFPVMGGVTDQYLNGETTDPCADSRAAENRLVGPSISSLASGPVMRKPPQMAGSTMFRPAKGEDYVHSVSPQHSSMKYVSWKTIPNVTQPKRSGRPPKNETGDRLMGRAMIKAGIEGPQGHSHPQMHHSQSVDGMGDLGLGLSMRGAAPLVTPARGPKIMPRGRSGALPRRDITGDGSGGYGMIPIQAGPSPYRSISVPSPLKKVGQFRSAQAAEEAHTREMMEAAQNALAPSNATLSGHTVMMSVSTHQDSIVLPGQDGEHSSLDLHHGDLPRTPAKIHSFTSPLSSVSSLTSPPHSGPRRTISESQEMNMLLQEPLLMNPDGLPVTPGGVGKTRTRCRTPRSRQSISESTASASQTTSPHGHLLVSPSGHHPRLQTRPLHSSPQRPVISEYKSPSGSMRALAQGPSTMASAQLQMSSNAPMPSLLNQTYHQPPVVSRERHMGHMGLSPGRPYYDTHGGNGAPLITASGSSTYTPRRRKEKETDESVEAVEAAVSRNVKNIMQAEKTHRQSSTWSHTLSPRHETSDDQIIRGSQVEQPKKETKRTSPSKKKQSSRVEKRWSMDEEESEGDGEDGGDWLVTCICGTTDDDGEEMVQCDHCKLRWEHVDCIFPVTKKAPEGSYVCHHCKPRPTTLSREQARAYQDRVKEQKEEQKMKQNEEEVKRKLAERAKRKEENCRKPVSMSRSSHVKGVAAKIEKCVSSYHYREIEKNEYSANARRLLAVTGTGTGTRSSRGQDDDAEIIKMLREKPRVKSLMVEPRIYGLIATKEIEGGDYIAELCGHVSVQKDCPNRDLAPGSFNDHTFLFEKDGDKLILDARKCGNYARHIRRSCKPNAELDEIMSGSELHIMIKAKNGAEINKHDEVAIGLEPDWRKRGRPAQGCVCSGEEKVSCLVDQFFVQKVKMDNSRVTASSSRRSLPSLPPLSSFPTNGTTPKDRNPIRRAETEKKKGGSGKKKEIMAKKGKKKGTIKLARHSRKSKGGSGSTADESEREGEETEEYEESTADEREKEKEKETSRRGRRNTLSSSEGKEKEVKKEVKKEEENRCEMPVLAPTRSSGRNRNDSDEVKKEAEVPKYEEKKKNESGGGKKEGRKSGVEKDEEKEKEVKEEIKEESCTPSIKKEKIKKPWPTMNYSLPSERNKPSREERKIEAEWKRLEKSEKKDGGSSGRGRGRPAQSLTPLSRPNEDKGEKGDKARSGRGKRKTETEDDRVAGEEREETEERPPKKRWTHETKKMEKEKETSSPAPSCLSSLSSITSPPRDDIPAASPAPAAGKKKWLHRHQEEQKAKAEKEAAAAAAATSLSSTTSTSSTPTRSKRLKKEKEEKGEKGAVEVLLNMGGMKEKRGGGGVRDEMKRHALKLRRSLKTNDFSIGNMRVEGLSFPLSTPSTPCTGTAGPSTRWIPHPMTPSISSLPSDLPSTTRIDSGKKPRMSLDEYKKRKQSGGVMSGGMKKEEESEKKEEQPPKKSFMPSVDSSTGLAPVSLPHVNLPGLEEKVDINELARRVYGHTPKRDGSSSSSLLSMGKTQPTPKRQSINDRLKNEFALPSLVTASVSPLPSSSLPPLPPLPSSSSSLPSTSIITFSSPSISSISTPTGGRIHKNRLSDERADNIIPPGLIERPHPSFRPPFVSPSTSSSQELSHTPSTPSKNNYSFHQKAASVRSTSK